MSTKKFFILLLSLTTNIYSQSNEVKEFQSKLIKVETLIDSESKFTTKSLQNCWI